jgi:hypothetical protein
MQHHTLFPQYPRRRDDVPDIFSDYRGGHEIKRVSQVDAFRPAHATDETFILKFAFSVAPPILAGR